MPKIRFYHVRALLWTYLGWAILNLSLAYSLCDNAPFRHRYPFTRVLYLWVELQHTLPLVAWWDGTMGFPWGVVAVAGSCVVAGPLTNGRGGRFLVIVGMSVWFFWAQLLLGITV